MNELYVALIAGGLAVLGSVLTSIIMNYHARKMYVIQRESEHQKHLREKKEDIYYKIFEELNLAQSGNPFISMQRDLNLDGEKICEIETLLQLYALDEIIFKFHQAHEAAEADLPHQETEGRIRALRNVIRRDIEVVTAKRKNVEVK